MNPLHYIALIGALATSSFAAEPLDWNAIAKKIVGKWKTTIVSNASANTQVPVVFDIRDDGTARMQIMRRGEEPYEQELNYCLGREVISFYDPKKKEPGDVRMYAWKIVGEGMELVYFGGDRSPLYFKRVEQAGAGQPATRSESDSEGGDKPQPESEGRSR